MKVEIVGIQPFNSSISVNPGDTLRVSHIVNGVEYKKCEQELTEFVIWTHSILFRLDGTLNHIIGDQKTVDWIEGLAGK